MDMIAPAPPLWRARRSLPRRVRTRLNNIERSRLRIIFVVLALGPLALLAYVTLGISTSVIREREKSRLQQEANLSAAYINASWGAGGDRRVLQTPPHGRRQPDQQPASGKRG